MCLILGYNKILMYIRLILNLINMKNEVNFMHYPAVYNDTPFYNEFYDHLNKAKGLNRAEYNLIVSKRDVTLYVKHKIKPYSGYRITDLKKYFGLKGSGFDLLNSFLELYNQYFELKNEILEKCKKGKIELTAY